MISSKYERKILEAVGTYLTIIGIGAIVVILGYVQVFGSWRELPPTLQTWGEILRVVNEVPVLGFFSHLLWGVFLLPGIGFSYLAKKLKKLQENQSQQNLEQNQKLVFSLK